MRRPPRMLSSRFQLEPYASFTAKMVARPCYTGVVK